MKKFKDNINDRIKLANTIRKINLEVMEKSETTDSAKWHMRHKPYAAAELIKRQGEQIHYEEEGEES